MLYASLLSLNELWYVERTGEWLNGIRPEWASRRRSGNHKAWSNPRPTCELISQTNVNDNGLMHLADVKIIEEIRE